MPEGPSVVILKEEVRHLTGKKIISVKGNAKIDLNRLNDQKVKAFRSWGKHFLICFDDFFVRIHFLMWGSYKLNEEKDRPVRLSLSFKEGTTNFYSCSVKIVEEDPDSFYDFTADVMSDTWDPEKALQKIVESPGEMACDVLLDQEIFSGVGNIIKNEVLYRIHVHPESFAGNMTLSAINDMIREARTYSFEFYEWKKKYELKKHWLAHTKKICLRCNLPFIRRHTGKRDRRSFFCENCQVLYK